MAGALPLRYRRPVQLAGGLSPHDPGFIHPAHDLFGLCLWPHSKFEAVVVDFKERAKALELLKTSRQMTSHKAAIVLAILNSNNEMPSAFRAGASFVLVKPLSPAVLMRTLRVSYPLMVNERRRSFSVSR